MAADRVAVLDITASVLIVILAPEGVYVVELEIAAYHPGGCCWG